MSYDVNTLQGFSTTSAKIRYLLACGMSRSQVAKTLQIRYQHVRNVQLQPLKKAAPTQMIAEDLGL